MISRDELRAMSDGYKRVTAGRCPHRAKRTAIHETRCTCVDAVRGDRLRVALHARSRRSRIPTRSRSRIIVPFTPGTGIDILARTLGQKLGERWKAPVVVENRAGASGNIGTEAVAKSPPDGYTLLMTASTIVLNRSLFKTIPYDPVKDFAPVAPLALGSLALVTHPSLPAKIGDASSSRSPRRARASSTTRRPATARRIISRWSSSSRAPGSTSCTCRTRGPAQAVQDLLGGQVSVMFLPVHVALPQAQAASSSCSPRAAPSAPRDAERAVARRGGRRARHRRRHLVRAVRAGRHARRDRHAAQRRRQSRCCAMPDVRDTLAQAGPARRPAARRSSSRELTRTDLERWAKVVRDAKIQPD